jgi:hypothetical protein
MSPTKAETRAIKDAEAARRLQRQQDAQNGVEETQRPRVDSAALAALTQQVRPNLEARAVPPTTDEAAVPDAPVAAAETPAAPSTPSTPSTMVAAELTSGDSAEQPSAGERSVPSVTSVQTVSESEVGERSGQVRKAGLRKLSSAQIQDVTSTFHLRQHRGAPMVGTQFRLPPHLHTELEDWCLRYYQVHGRAVVLSQLWCFALSRVTLEAILAAEPGGQDPSSNHNVPARMTKEVSERLTWLAVHSRCSKSFIAAIALEAFLRDAREVTTGPQLPMP